MKKKYQIFVSSTYKDLINERAAAVNALLDMDFIPVGMEQFPSSPMKQWEYITKMIDMSDYYLLILAGRYGSIDKESGLGYTEKEYQYAQEKGIPRIAFLHRDIGKIPMDKSAENDAEKQKLKEFRTLVENDGLVNYFENEDELKAMIMKSVSKLATDCPRTGWIRADQIESSIDKDKYLQEIKELLEKLQVNIAQQVEELVPKWEPISKEDIDALFDKAN